MYCCWFLLFMCKFCVLLLICMAEEIGERLQKFTGGNRSNQPTLLLANQRTLAIYCHIWVGFQWVVQSDKLERTGFNICCILLLYFSPTFIDLIRFTSFLADLEKLDFESFSFISEKMFSFCWLFGWSVRLLLQLLFWFWFLCWYSLAGQYMGI